MPWLGLSVQDGVQQLRLGHPLASHSSLRTEGRSAQRSGQKAPVAFSLAGGGWVGPPVGMLGQCPHGYGQDGSPGHLPLARGPAELGPSHALCLPKGELSKDDCSSVRLGYCHPPGKGAQRTSIAMPPVQPRGLRPVWGQTEGH